MVPENPITQNEEYSYGRGIFIELFSFFLSLLISSIVDNTEPMALPPAPCVNEFDSGKHESNEEFIARLKHMGKSRLTLIFVNKIR